MDLTIVFHDKDLAIRYALDLTFDLVKGRDICKGGEAFELVFLGHGCKAASLGVIEGWGWYQTR
jgi:hypothetical protein